MEKNAAVQYRRAGTLGNIGQITHDPSAFRASCAYFFSDDLHHSVYCINEPGSGDGGWPRQRKVDSLFIVHLACCGCPAEVLNTAVRLLDYLVCIQPGRTRALIIG